MKPIVSPPQGRPRTTALLVLGCFVGLSAACAGDDDDNTVNDTGGSSTAAYAAERKACVDRINAFRATLDLPALERWTDAEACTDGQAKSDSQSGDAHGAFGDCKEFAQNECPGWGSVQQTI